MRAEDRATLERPIIAKAVEAAVENHLTTEEALRWISKAPRGTRFHLHVMMDVPVAGSADSVFQDGAHGAVRLPGHDMMDFIRGGLSAKLEERGARWRCQVTKFKSLDRTYVNYWVG